MSRFIIVTGLPASGKSTVGAAIAGALALPLLDKDEILEALFDSLGVGDAEWRTRLSRASDHVLQRLAMRSNGAVVVSWWRHPLSHVASGTSASWLHSLPGEVVEVHCRCDSHVAARRFLARPRHGGHLDEQGGAFERFVWPGALGIGRVIELDTEQAINIEALVEQLASPGG
ncbi:MAG TPA: AAA family ATPase [Longimicrobium sp.]|nr:AAA family ATPase [Longimicrobium sp.]